ncbi:M13 family peptidase [Bdellovibrio sp. qaytius]|nr:M13 family peptidase [Bdellovibrio sp. qaytius]
MKIKSSTIGIGVILSALTIIPIAYAANTNEHAKDVVPSSEIPEKREYPLNDKANPCDDFHKYVCSNVEASFKLREDRSAHYFAFEDSDERLLEKKKTFFKNINDEKKLSPRSLQMKQYYMACMNEASSAAEEKELVAGLRTDLDKLKSIEDYIKFNKENMLNEKWGFVGYDLGPNIDDPKIYDLMFDLNVMFLPEHSYYDNKELMTAYRDLVTEFFMAVYPEGNKDEFKKRAQAMIDFETRFKATYPMPAEFRKRWTEPRYVTREEFLKRTSAIGLDDFISKNIPKKTLIRDFIPESFEFMQKELKNENLQVLKDMYFFRSARGYMDDAYPELFKKRMEFSHKFLGGAPSRPDRQERCTTSVMGSFNRELDLEMLPRLFPHFPKEKMRTVAEGVRKSIIDGLKANSWLSAQGKKGAIAKIERAKLQLIQPYTDKEWDFKAIQKYSEDKPYYNGKLLALQGHAKNLKRFKEGVNQDAWGMGPLTVNAYYSADKNKFVMPIGILQYPFFVPEGDVIENLGAVGAVVAHELGHAIDDEGSKFDDKGRLKQWMTDADVNTFKERGQRMVEQFNKIGHNGELTLGENTADLVGLTFAYKAAFPKGVGSVEDKKKFFVAFGRLWCGVARDKMKEMLLKTDPHSLGYARINEQVKHQPGFAEAFSCKENNKLFLNEKDRIQIW